MGFFSKHRDYINFLSHEQEPPEKQPTTTYIQVRSLGIPSVVIVNRG